MVNLLDATWGRIPQDKLWRDLPASLYSHLPELEQQYKDARTPDELARFASRDPSHSWLGRHVFRTKLPPNKYLNRYEKGFEKREKGSEKWSETCPNILSHSHAA